MNVFIRSRSRRNIPWAVTAAARAVVLLVPAALLLLGVARTTGSTQVMLTLGAGFQVLVCLLAFASSRSWRQPVSPSLISLYLIALGWLWLGSAHQDDWYEHFAQAVLLIVPVTVFALQTLTNSGAPAMRRARMLAQSLAKRKDWPADLSTCRNLPEVKALREAIHFDATPALNLLGHSRVAVRVAALATLEFRKNWRPGQAELVLQYAQRAQEPDIRMAAMNALANLDDRILVEAVANFLMDSSLEVRKAAAEAVLWDCEHRWSWVRHAVRGYLGNGALQDDGPLQSSGEMFTDEAVNDFNAWASEKGVLGVRAAQTLGVHYARAIQEQSADGIIMNLQGQLANPHAPPLLRLELARILRNCDKLCSALQEKLLDPANPALLRLQAAESLLSGMPHPRAISTLYDVARLPNREIALATAAIVQRCLNVDLGLPVGQPLPPVNSRQAAEVTRRVMLWAAQPEIEAMSVR